MNNIKLVNKTVLIISPQSWGKMFVSKHHYAIELSKSNLVYFLNPPTKNDSKWITINELNSNLKILSYQSIIPIFIKFHWRWLYDGLITIQIKLLLKKIKTKIDIVWCFDMGTFSNLRLFKSNYVIYQPVDQVIGNYQKKIAQSADVIASVSPQILDVFKPYNSKLILVNHGLNSIFVKYALSKIDNSYINSSHKKIKVGYMGNLFIPIIDKNILRIVINKHIDIDFHFWGPINAEDSNLSADISARTVEFVQFLKEAPNVILHGVMNQDELAIGLHSMDAFLICYDIIADQNKGSNTHKLLEFLSTGKVIISNKISTYLQYSHLVQMAQKIDNSDYPELFKETISKIDYHNSTEKQIQRINLALENTVEIQINKIVSFLFD